MGHRLSKIYTKTGDDGTTGLGDGSRISKSALRIAAIGDIDELNSVMGLVISETDDSLITDLLSTIQHHLFDCGAELCLPDYHTIKAEHSRFVEQSLDQINQALPRLKEFILPGGSKDAAYCHLARSICRRAERTLVSLDQDEKLSEDLLRYLNRLSDLLFVIARHLARRHGEGEVLWQNKKVVD